MYIIVSVAGEPNEPQSTTLSSLFPFLSTYPARSFFITPSPPQPPSCSSLICVVKSKRSGYCCHCFSFVCLISLRLRPNTAAAGREAADTYVFYEADDASEQQVYNAMIEQQILILILLLYVLYRHLDGARSPSGPVA